jgi:hypothetical protein
MIDTVAIKNNDIQSKTRRRGIFRVLRKSTCHSNTNSPLDRPAILNRVENRNTSKRLKDMRKDRRWFILLIIFETYFSRQ